MINRHLLVSYLNEVNNLCLNRSWGIQNLFVSRDFVFLYFYITGLMCVFWINLNLNKVLIIHLKANVIVNFLIYFFEITFRISEVSYESILSCFSIILIYPI